MIIRKIEETINQEIPKINSQLEQKTQRINEISINIEDYKTEQNSWNESFELAYQKLPQYGGTIFIPNSITIQKSINLYELFDKYGIKKVMIEGRSKMNNPSTNYNSVIIKEGNFDGVILAHGCGMKDISVSRNTKIADNGDGIYVAGITCSLENVYVNDQGGDGIRVGSKSTETTKRNCNIGRFINIGAYNNGGWGIKVCDDLSNGINTSDANACIFIAPDCRENKKGGILFEKCMDNQVYSPDCEVNYGEAGIKLGDETGGISIYSPYTENSGCTYEILIAESSYNNIILGYRTGGINDSITDLNGTNFILGKLGSKLVGHYVKNNLNTKAVTIADETALGYFKFNQNKTSNTLELIYGGATRDNVVEFKNNSSTNKLGIRASFIDLGDRINTVRVRPGSAIAEFNIPANSSVVKTVVTNGIYANSHIVGSPFSQLPSGVSYYCLSEADGYTKVVFTNSTTNQVTVPQMNWRFFAINPTALS